MWHHCIFDLFKSWNTQAEKLVDSVANTAVYPLNWATLKSSAVGKKKLLGRWPKIGQLFNRLLAAALFSSNLPVSYQLREFLSIFSVQEHVCHQFQGLRHPAEQSIRLSTSRGSQQSNCFSSQLGDFDYFTAEKHPNLWNWAYNYLIKIGLL